MKFTQEDLQGLTTQQNLLIINFATLMGYCNTDWVGIYNCYQECVNLLDTAKTKLNLTNEDVDFLYNFFLENDHY